MASSRLQESRDAVIKFGLLDKSAERKEEQDEDDTPEVLVPLTSSVYVKVSTDPPGMRFRLRPALVLLH